MLRSTVKPDRRRDGTGGGRMDETAGELGSKLDALARLSSEPSSERRRELLREITDVFFAPVPPPPRVAELFDAALERMTDTLGAELRVELAQRLLPAPRAPRRLLTRLAADPLPEVAEAVLEGCASLTEADLALVVATAEQRRLRAVSRRGDLTETLSDRIVARGDDDTLGVLVANPAAPLSRAASEAVVDRALENPALHEAVVGRDGLAVDLLTEMYLVVETRLRERIVARNAALDPAVLDAALKVSRRRVAVREGLLPPDYEAAVASVRRSAERGPIPPQSLAAYLRAGEQTRFTAALAHACELDYATVRRVLDRRDVDALALICRAADYDAALFRTLLVLMPAPLDEPLAAVVDRFSALPRESALRVVRFWKVRRGGEALAA